MAGRASFGGAVKLTGDNEYKKALADITRSLKVVSAEMKATSTSFDAGDKSEKELAEETEKYNNALKEQKKSLSD